MKDYKRILASLMVAVMVLTAAPLSGFVGIELPDFEVIFSTKAEAAENDVLSFSSPGTTATFTKCDPDASGHIVIPSSIDGRTVTAIGESAFLDCTGVTGVTIPDTVKYIDKRAFKNCTALTSIELPDSIIDLSNAVFENCTSLESVVLSDNLTEIPDETFMGCSSLVSVTIPDGVTYLGGWAFAGCTSLKNVSIGSGVEVIGEGLFQGCESLGAVYYNGTRADWAKVMFDINTDSVRNAEIVFTPGDVSDSGACGDSVMWELYADGTLVIYGSGNMSSYASKSKVPWNQYADLIKTVVIEQDVTGFSAFAFADYTQITDVYYGGTLAQWCAIYFEDIHANPIQCAENFCISGIPIDTTLVIPEGVTSIGQFAFAGCKIFEEVGFCAEIESIGTDAFYGCTEVSFVAYLGDLTSWCEINFENEYANPMFYGNELYIGDSYIEGELVIPDGVTSIGCAAFSGCTQLTNVTIPDSVTEIKMGAFAYCSNMTSITIGNGITDIGDHAFNSCNSLETVNYNGIESDWKKINVGSGNATLTSAKINFLLNVVIDSGTCGENLTWILYEDGELVISGMGAMTNYSNLDHLPAAPWYDYSKSINTVTVEDGVTSIGDFAFYFCSEIENVTIPDSVTSIGSWVFACCHKLKDVMIPDSVKSIGYKAFTDCNNLTEVTIPASVTTIGDEAFYSCSNLISITVDEANPAYSSDEHSVLFNKDKTVLIQYPDGNKSTEYIIPDTVVRIERSAFGCKYLENVIIPDGVTDIGDFAFSGCASITSIYIPSSVTSIGTLAFYMCSCLTSITVDEESTAYCNDEYGVLFNKKRTELVKYPEGNERTNYVIPDGVKKVAWGAFSDSKKLTEITIPDSLTTIGNSAFDDCNSLTNITIPDGVTVIGSSAFMGCDNLTSITIPDGVTIIEANTFTGCRNLTSVTIPSGVRIIDDYAFSNCPNLTEVYFLGTQEQWDAIIIGDTKNEALASAHKHNCEKVEAKQVTCEEDGYTEGLYCTDCEMFVVGHEIIPTEGHDYIIDETPATCTTSGKRIHTCSVCGDSYTELIYATGHDLEDYRLDPTCKEPGYECYKCINCGVEYAREELDVIPHTEGDWEVIEASTCTATGIRIKKCTACGDELQRETIPMLPHSYEESVVTEPTCVAEGLKRFTCAVCGDSYDETTPATGIHTIKDVRVEPTCTAEGEIQHWCEVCGNMIGESDVIPMIPHTYELVVTEPTCVAEGLKRFTCAVCGDSYDETIPATGVHTTKDVRIEPTCIAEGEIQHWCEICGNMIGESDAIPMIPHPYEESVVIEPTCVAEGTKRYTCSVCGDNYDEQIPATGEHTTIAIRKEPTCTNIGTEQYICQVCGDMIGDLVILPKTDHPYGDWIVVTAPTLNEDGSKEHSCAQCGKTESAAIPAIKFELAEGVTIDFATGIISGIDAGSTSLDSYTIHIDEGYIWSYETQNGRLGTGSKAIIKNGDTVVAEYTMLVYGDTNGDSWYDGQDAVLVSCLANGMLSKEDVGEAVYMAADCNHDGVIDQLDVDLLNEAGTLLANVDQSKPAEVLLETSSEYVEYLDLIDQSPEIEAEDETDSPEADVETENTTPEQDAKVDVFEMIMNFIKSIFEMLFVYIPMPIK